MRKPAFCTAMHILLKSRICYDLDVIDLLLALNIDICFLTAEIL